MLDDAVRFVPQGVADPDHPKREVDLLRRVEELLGITANCLKGFPAHSVSASEEIRTGTTAMGMPDAAPKGELSARHGSVGPHDTKGEDPKGGVGVHPGTYQLIDGRPEHGVVIEEHEHVRARGGCEQVAPRSDSNVVVTAYPDDARSGHEGRIRCHVHDDHFVPGVAPRRLQRRHQFVRPVVADDAEPELRHAYQHG
jgi:hypothetical protein